MSAVMTMAAASARSAIQSSATSGPWSTTICLINLRVGVRIQLLETTNTGSW